jgi:hypothetical protein
MAKMAKTAIDEMFDATGCPFRAWQGAESAGRQCRAGV